MTNDFLKKSKIKGTSGLSYINVFRLAVVFQAYMPFGIRLAGDSSTNTG